MSHEVNQLPPFSKGLLNLVKSLALLLIVMVIIILSLKLVLQFCGSPAGFLTRSKKVETMEVDGHR